MCEWLLNLGGGVFAICPAHSHPTTTQVRIYEFHKKSKLVTPCFNQHGIVWESVVMHVNERVVMQVSERVMMNVSENVVMHVGEREVMHVSEREVVHVGEREVMHVSGREVMHVSGREVMHVSCHWHILRIFISEGARPVMSFLLNVSSKVLR